MRKNDATKNQKAGHTVKGVVAFTDIPAQLEQLKREKEWTSGHNAITIFKLGTKTQTLISLRNGAALEASTFSGTVTILVLHGSLSFISKPVNMELSNGQMATVQPGFEHSLRAIEDSFLLLIKDA